jgi:signal transduction histidine kinase
MLNCQLQRSKIMDTTQAAGASFQKDIDEKFVRGGGAAFRVGLALVKKFAEAHNGFAEIISAKPVGAIFRIGLTTQS